MPKLGLAFSQQQIENLPDRDPTRQILLEQCVLTGLCTPEKREALLTWPGSFRALFPGEKWPARFRKWLDVKIVYQPNQPLEAKGFLGSCLISHCFRVCEVLGHFYVIKSTTSVIIRDTTTNSVARVLQSPPMTPSTTHQSILPSFRFFCRLLFFPFNAASPNYRL
jgi:hypothetical protein